MAKPASGVLDSPPPRSEGGAALARSLLFARVRPRPLDAQVSSKAQASSVGETKVGRTQATPLLRWAQALASGSDSSPLAKPVVRSPRLRESALCRSARALQGQRSDSANLSREKRAADAEPPPRRLETHTRPAHSNSHPKKLKTRRRYKEISRSGAKAICRGRSGKPPQPPPRLVDRRVEKSDSKKSATDCCSEFRSPSEPQCNSPATENNGSHSRGTRFPVVSMRSPSPPCRAVGGVGIGAEASELLQRLLLKERRPFNDL